MVARNVRNQLPSDAALCTKTRIQHFLNNRPQKFVFEKLIILYVFRKCAPFFEMSRFAKEIGMATLA